MSDFGLHGLELPKQDASYSDKLLLAENLFQLEYAKRQSNGKSTEERLVEYGDDIPIWLNSKEGEGAFDEYVRSHSEKDIENGKDMDKLVQKYEDYRKTHLH